jgi:hypothetical protein
MALTRPKIWDLDTTIEAFVDPITVLHQGSSLANVDVGFLFNRANGLVSNVALYWSESLQSFVTTYTTSTGVINSNIVVTSYANLTIGSLFSINGNIYLNGSQGAPGQYITATSSGTAWTSSSFTGGVISSTTYPNANLSINLGTTTGYWANVYTGNLIVGQNVLWGNGTVFSSGTGGASTYSNANVASYLPTYSGSFGGDISIGGNLTVTGNTIFRNTEIVVGVEIVTGNLVANSGTASTSTTTGALVVSGGVGVSGSTNIGGNIVAGSTLNTASWVTVSNVNSYQVSMAVNAGYSLMLGFGTQANPTQYMTLAASGNKNNLYNTTRDFRVTANNDNLDAIYVTNANGNVILNSTTTSTSNVTGALVVAGGVGVSGNVYTNNRVGFVYANSVSSVYTIFNQATASYDIVFG